MDISLAVFKGVLPRCAAHLWAAILMLALATGCTDPKGVPDPSELFEPSGPAIVRELGVFSGDERVGSLRTGRRVGVWNGTSPAVELTENVHLRLSFRGDRFLVTSGQASWVGEGLELLGSTGSVDFGAGSWETRIVKIEPGVYQREQMISGSRDRDRVTVPEGSMLSDVLPLYMGGIPFEKGRIVELGVFNMILGQELPMTLEFKGVTEEGRLYALTYWGFEERVWLDRDGMVAREDMALGVSARASGGGERTGHLSLEKVLSQTSVPGIGVPEDLGARAEAVLTLEGSFRPPPDGPWQRVSMVDRRAVLRLLRPSVPEGDRRIPDMKAMPGDAFGLDLDSPRIRDLALEITGSMDDPWEKALAIALWVNRETGKSMRECFSALQVLETGEGECQSHSLLTVSLCRAAGLPARFAYGVVYLPDRREFGFHTWVEVHVGDWVPLDPTLANFPAGVDHVTLAVGSYQDQFRLFPYIMGKGGWRIRYGEQ